MIKKNGIGMVGLDGIQIHLFSLFTSILHLSDFFREEDYKYTKKKLYFTNEERDCFPFLLLHLKVRGVLLFELNCS
jgi:hypothetical protein